LNTYTKPMIKVRIKKQAKARTGYQVNGSLANDISPMGGGDYNKGTGKPKLKESRYITADPREEANVEAEGGELVYGDINGDFFPETQIIKGPRHSGGGVPLNLPEDTFIFSDTRSMKIKDCEILTMFGKPCGKQSYTPANLAKQYDVQKYRVLLEDPNSNAIEKKTAELMIKNYVIKLGCLALKQESMKGFPQGIPVVARPCMEAKGITEEQVLPSKELAQLKSQLESQKEQEEQGEQGGNENFLNEAMGMNEGRPVAQPQPMQQQPPQQIQPAPQPMMQEGGGYSDIYRQQMQEQEGAQQQMMQLMQQVQSALEQGAAPEQVVQALLHDQIPPESIAQIFIELGMPEQDVVGLIQQSMAAAQQPQQGQQSMAKDGLSIMQSGGTVNIDRADYDTEEEFQQELRNAYAKVGSGGKIYVTHDGKRYLQKVSPKNYDSYDDVDNDLATKWHGNQVAAASYQALTKMYSDPLVQERLATEFRKTIKEQSAYKRKNKLDGTAGGYSKYMKDVLGYDISDEADPNYMSNEEITNQYLRMQERNLRTNTIGDKLGFDVFGSWMYKDRDGKLRDFESTGSGIYEGKRDKRGFKDVVMDAYAGNPNLGPVPSESEIQEMYDKLNVNDYKSLSAISSNLGLPMESGYNNPNQIGLKANTKEAMVQQAAFIAADNLMKDFNENYDDYSEAEQKSMLGITSFDNYTPYGKSVGYNDELVAGETNISPDDGEYTNSTQGQIQGIHQLSFEDEAEQLPPCDCIKQDGTLIELERDENGNCPPCEEDVNVQVPGEPASYWLQDTINTTGAFGDLMGLKKRMPWAPGVDLEEPRPTFLDPTRELAANAEQANIQTQGMAQFAGPQALSSRSSGIQGQAAKNAADVLAKYNNANVNVANQFELKATDIRNQESMLRQATSQRVYDQTTMANQQFDNSKLAMRNNLRNQYTNAITNRWKTDAMNQMYPDYAVDPSVGGRMHHTPNSRNPSPTTGEMTRQEAMDWCKQNNPSAKDHSACMQRVFNMEKNKTTSQQGHPNMYPYKEGGQVNAGYTYFNPWFDDGI